MSTRKRSLQTGFFKYKNLQIILFLLSFMITNVFAESNKNTAAEEFLIESNAENAAQISPGIAQEKWQKERLVKLKQNTPQQPPTSINSLLQNKVITLPEFPPPPKPGSDASDFLNLNLMALLVPVADFLIPAAQAANVYGGITVDGDLGEWTANERINFPLDRPPYLADAQDLYGKYIAGDNPVYVFALKSPTTTIQGNTTLYLNTDQTAATGLAPGGFDYAVNINPADLVPNLYDQAFNWLTALEYAYSSDKNNIEIVVPASRFTILTASKSINVVADINDLIFLPEFFDGSNQFTIAGTVEPFPVRTDPGKRVGIVYSATTGNFFYGEKAYSQLFMSLQHQAMMAGISFDLLTENDLTNLARLVNYDALIFPFAANIPDTIKDQVRHTLYTAIYKNPKGTGLGIITADNWLTDDELNKPLPGDSYQVMKQLLGISRVNGAGPVQIDVTAGDVTHPAMKDYHENEAIITYPAGFTSYFQSIPGQASTILAYQTVTGFGKVPAVIANTTGGRNVHFASINLLGDSSLAWQALQWVVFGNDTPIALKMGRYSNLFIARNDLDQAQEHDEMSVNDIPLYSLLQSWKSKYNFVGSYYMDIGNDPANGQWTDWTISGPLFKKYLALDNEMGSHSWTHPEDTNLLSPAQIEFEFNQSMNEISKQLGPTWRAQNIRGGAIPGMPDSLSTAAAISQYWDYVSGGWASIGAGFPSAIGYLTPDFTKVYFSPNMTFDFTLLEFGVLPHNQFGVPTSTSSSDLVKLTATQAFDYWKNEINILMKHASQPVIHWPWHDYGPTSSSQPVTGKGYSVDMYENTIAYAKNNNSEFITLADAAQRINTFRQAKMTVTAKGSIVSTQVNSNNVGKFSLVPDLPTGQIIQKVNGWYAYNDKQVFLDDDGGTFDIQAGTGADDISHITALPMRARLISVAGDGNRLSFSFEGEGSVTVKLSNAAINYAISSNGGTVTANGNNRTIGFNSFGIYSVNIKPGLPSGVFTARAQAVHSGKCMRVSGGSALPLAPVVQNNCSSVNSQKLIFTPVANKPSVYTIKFTHSKQCLDVLNKGTANGVQLVQFTCGTGLNQQFKLVAASNGAYNLIAQHSGKLVDVFNAALQSGAKVIQWSANGGDNQKWLLTLL